MSATEHATSSATSRDAADERLIQRVISNVLESGSAGKLPYIPWNDVRQEHALFGGKNDDRPVHRL
jgi:hypothetical protein